MYVLSFIQTLPQLIFGCTLPINICIEIIVMFDNKHLRILQSHHNVHQSLPIPAKPAKMELFG